MGRFLSTSPSLDSERFPTTRLLMGTDESPAYLAFDPADGRTLWQFPLQGFPEGIAPVEASRAYIGTRGGPFDRHVYCVDTSAPRQVWRYDGSLRDIQGAVALGQAAHGRVYALAVGDWLYCLNASDGSEVWRSAIGAGLAKYAPIVDGRETVYYGIATIGWRVSAIRPDGTRLWTRDMPERVFPSPVIGPDGTLYAVCSDKYLYAFRDLRGDMNCDMQVNNFDIDGFVLALIDPDAYDGAYPDCNHMLADVNEDGSVDNFDIDPFVDCLLNGDCP